MNKIKYIVLFITVILSCKENLNSSKESYFEIPKLYNSRLFNNDSIKKNEFEFAKLTQSNPIFIGKFKFKDSIDINPKFKEYASSLSDENIEKTSFSGLEIFIDYETTVYYNWDGYFPDSDLVFAYYPAYLVNSTNSNKILFGKDGHIFGIQEAIDKESFDFWKPIEARPFDFCGNGSWRIAIEPNEFGLILMKKYKGDYTTKLRTRIKNGDNIIVSNDYYGKINKSQFKIADSSSIKRRLINSDSTDNTFSLFYGAKIDKN